MNPHYSIKDNTEFSCDLFPYCVVYCSRLGIEKVIGLFCTWSAANIFAEAMDIELQAMSVIEEVA